MAHKYRGHENVSAFSLQGIKIADGWLQKYGGHGIQGNWKTRYFVLTKEYLYYYQSPKDPHPKGVANLNIYARCEDTQEKKRKNLFKLSSTNTSIRVFYFSASSQTDMNRWISAIKAVLKDIEIERVKESLQSTSLRIVRTLDLRISEARKLPTMNHLKGRTDPYCLAFLGDQNIRSQTVCCDKNPLWNEDHQLQVKDPNESLTITVFHEDLISKDSPIGKIVVPISSLSDQERKEQWLTLMPEDYVNFVSGDVRLQLRYHAPEGELKVAVIEARNLASKDSNGLSDPYIKLKFGKEKKKTEVVRKTLNPTYNESFSFKVPPAGEDLLVEVWDWDRLSSNEFMGQVVIPWKDLEPSMYYDKWYTLSSLVRSLSTSEEGHHENDKYLGDIRITLRYSVIKILPSEYYNELLKLISEPNLNIVNALGTVSLEKELVAKNVVNIFYARENATNLITLLTGKEVNDTQVIFRGNSIATKAVDYYLKLIGKHYLKSILGPKIREIYQHAHSCEIDPTRLEKGENPERNAERLSEVVVSFLNAIFQSLKDCPGEIREVCRRLQQRVIAKYGVHHITRYTAISGFIFLRFWCPAIVNPKLYGIEPEHPTKEARTLTMAVKAIQSLANLVKIGAKEPYMQVLNGLIESNISTMKDFIDELSAETKTSFPQEQVTEVIDMNKELAILHQQLLKNRENIMKTDYQVQNLPEVIDRLSAAIEKEEQQK